ncbi:MAG: CDP-glycerol glycerophosphotransferase family protein [Desulfobulbaceae bacterium]|nr:CDP-glycerol glycerophosphotransferase family protein [Desulfobulbaceae bacterium]
MATKKRQQYRILFVLPTHFASRNVLSSNIPAILNSRTDVSATFVSLYPEDEVKVDGFQNDRLTWKNLKKPVAFPSMLNGKILSLLFCNFCYALVHALLLNRAAHGALVFRFNQIHNFFGHRLRKSMARWYRFKLLKSFRSQQGFNAQRYADPKLGWPFPNSKTLYNFFLRLYFWRFGNSVTVETLFDSSQFDVVVINYIQTARIFPYLNAAKRRDIPIIGMVGSWDNPTLKGPVAPGLSRYVVQNRYMADQLITHHDIDEKDIIITGWPQMDIYKDRKVFQGRERFFEELKLDKDARLILFGANTSRLGHHEPDILRHMIKAIHAGEYGTGVHIMIRPHPGDTHWRQRFEEFAGQPNVIMTEPCYTDRVYFTNLLQYSSIVISSAGTIALDASAFDTCAINISFDGDRQVSENESVKMFYKLEHYAAVCKTGGTRQVGSYEELDRAVVEYLADPHTDAEQRQALRHYHLEPFDGKASERLANVIWTFFY